MANASYDPALMTNISIDPNRVLRDPTEAGGSAQLRSSSTSSSSSQYPTLNYTPANAYPVASHVSGGTILSNGKVIANPPSETIKWGTPSSSPSPQPQAQQQQKSSGGGGGSQEAQWDAEWAAKHPGQGARPVGYHGESAGGNNLDNEISDMYKQYIGIFDQIGNTLRDQSAQDEQAVVRQYDEGYKKAQGEGEDLQKDLANRTNDFNESYRSAVAEALRAYQGLNQQKMARYGGGSSVGGALGELANQEFLRNQGKLLAQRTSGEQAFQLEGSRMKKYVDEKLSTWDNWKADALDKVRTNLRNGLNEIALRKGDAELNKTKDRISLLQDTINRARQVQDMDTQFRQNLTSYAVQKSAELSGNNFSIKDIPGIVNQLMGYNILGAGGGQGTASVRPGVKYDELGNLILG